MSKRSVAYIKPQEPSFLTKLKQEAGYKEGPTVDTKREALPQLNDEDFEDRDEELPTVVVLNPGDLTAEEAEQIKKQEKESAPADLSERIVFRKPVKDNAANASTSPPVSESKKRSSSDSRPEKIPKKSKKDKPKSSSSSTKLLSFDAEDEEES